jgi:hypothetical protein
MPQNGTDCRRIENFLEIVGQILLIPLSQFSLIDEGKTQKIKPNGGKRYGENNLHTGRAQLNLGCFNRLGTTNKGRLTKGY